MFVIQRTVKAALLTGPVERLFDIPGYAALHLSDKAKGQMDLILRLRAGRRVCPGPCRGAWCRGHPVYQWRQKGGSRG